MTDYQYASLSEKIAAEKAERNARYAEFESLWRDAVIEGMAAGQGAIPDPMIVTQHTSPFDDDSPVEKSWYVSEGVCGFAEVVVTPGNSSFALWAKKNAGMRKHYYGGVSLWVSYFGQSYDRKMAFATTVARVVNERLAAMVESGQLAKAPRVYGTGRLD